ncbi:MAG: hypothetical protein RL518_160 [Pseudomonadota bacterium]|jgi:hypothetical protein
MKRFIAAVAVLVVSSVMGVGKVEALSPPAVKAPTGRCLFPSGRTLGAVISAEAQKAYLSQGYKSAFVNARVVVKRPVVTTLSKANVSGLTSVSPTAGTPAILRITANQGGTPLELGCNAEAEITTTVVLIDSAGTRSNGRSVTKVTVQGAFQ